MNKADRKIIAVFMKLIINILQDIHEMKAPWPVSSRLQVETFHKLLKEWESKA